MVKRIKKDVRLPNEKKAILPSEKDINLPQKRKPVN